MKWLVKRRVRKARSKMYKCVGCKKNFAYDTIGDDMKTGKRYKQRVCTYCNYEGKKIYYKKK
jgi:DNA-directed RNA polymerase subunit RPC12/RpoP